MIRDAESRELFKARKNTLHTVMVEPVFGCGKFVCKGCCVASMPKEQEFMREANLKKALTFLKSEGVKPREFQYSLRGEPLDHPRLSRITALIREHYPKAGLSAITSLSGINDYKALESRSKGLNWLVVSLDGHHYARMLGILNEEGELTPKKLASKGFSTKKEAVFEEMRKRLRWATAASSNNQFQLMVNLIGSKKERQVMRELVKSALPGDNSKQLKFVSNSERNERGYDLSEDVKRDLSVFNNGKISYFFPKDAEK